MNRPKPPALASWVLEQLTRRTRNHALMGDLLEEFGTGRSSAWFWRQVLLALLTSVASALRRASVALCFAVLWTAGAPLWGRYFFEGVAHRFVELSWYLQFQWPWSMLLEISVQSALITIPIVVGMSVYIAGSRQFSKWRYFLAVLLAIVLHAAWRLTLPGFVHHRAGFWVASQFAILVITMWVAKGSNTNKQRLKSQLAG